MKIGLKLHLGMAFILALLLGACQSSLAQSQVCKVACVGNSITYGAGIVKREFNSYPAQLQAWLGGGFEVENFGYSGATALRSGDYPYVKTEAYARSLAYNPDIVVIKLGTNDSKIHNWKSAEIFRADYQFIIDSYLKLPSRPRIILATPLKCFLPDDSPFSNERIREIGKVVKELAEANALECVELYDLMGDTWDSSLMPDRLHPSSIGAGRLAARIGQVISPDLADIPASVHAVPGNEYRSAAGWVEGADWHAVAEDIVETLRGRKLRLLILGNSIMQGWGGNRKAVTYKPGREAMNEVLGENTWETAGISGDRTQNLLWRLRHDGYDICQPENVLIAIGVNNLIGDYDSPQETAAGIIAVTEEAERLFPDSHIILLGLLPSGLEPDSEIRRKCDVVQELLGKHRFFRAVYHNPMSWFLAPDGRIRNGLYGGDYIHLTSDGYRVLAAHVAEILK